MEKENVTLTIDAESNGLWGKPFVIGATVHNQYGELLHKFELRCKMEITCPWTLHNVIPYVQDIPVTKSYLELLKNFAKFYLEMRNKYNCEFLLYSGHIVEAFLFRELREKELIGFFNAPYVPIDLATVLILNQEDPTSLTAYYTKHNIEVPKGNLDTPLYDCLLTYDLYHRLTKS